MRKLLSVLIFILPLVCGTQVLAQSSAEGNITAELNYSSISKKLTKISTSLLKSTPKPEDVKADSQYISETRTKLLETRKDL